MIRLLAVVFACLLTGAAQAQADHYVTDSFTITVRTGKGNDFQVIRSIPTGTPVQVLQSTDDGYSHVRLSDGVEGWVLSRFLTDKPVARAQLADMRNRVQSLTEENGKLQDQVNALQQQQATLQDQLAGLQDDRRHLNAENERLRELAKNPEELRARNKALAQRVAGLERDVQLLQQKNSELKDRTNRDWFVAGGGVVLLGMLIGFVVGRAQRRRRSSWGSL